MKNNAISYLELLAPARDFEYGKAAVDHGADAIYIGAPRFGARSAAGNSIAEIEKLVVYAHLYRVKVYVTLNTILFDDEMEDARSIIQSLYNIGVDGIIIQDMGLLELDLPDIPIIASTQTHNTTPEKVKFLESLGIQRVILARELSLHQIREIRDHTTVELESFVHGALCVSYSGQCYMSEAICGRSGNRGLCAQPCRSSYDLTDGSGNVVVQNKHLLSLKDLNLSAYLEDLMDAGIRSFKIEGRLKDITYVKNVVSWYRTRIDAILETKSGLQKSSSGKSDISFQPDSERSFNRGFTSYFINGRKEKTGSPNTQKSLGKRLGYVLEKGTDWIKVDCDGISNGDGLCFFGSDDKLYGFAVQKVINNKVFVEQTTNLTVGTEIFRNHDQKFEKSLLSDCAERKIDITFTFKEVSDGFQLEALDEDGYHAVVFLNYPKTLAKNAELAQKSLKDQLSKLGGSAFNASSIHIELSNAYFFPASAINGLRREVIEKLQQVRINEYLRASGSAVKPDQKLPNKKLTYLGNVSNKFAAQFYKKRGIEEIEPALELTKSYADKVVMTTKHCIRYQLDACPVYQKGKTALTLPLYLRDMHHTYRLDFDCKKCEMHVIFEDK
ncbi:MAG TPA: U32 family peptidase [Bacteroidales bacterium]|nr:U32 family peptidase [Bacteroidales bacterium]